MKKYADLKLKEIAKKAGLDFAHWSCRGSCSCCVDFMYFPQKFFTKSKATLDEDNLQFILFKNAYNGSGDVDKDHIICYQSFESGKKASNRLYPVFVGWSFDEQNLDSVINLLQEQLGNKYKVIKPKNTKEAIEIQPLFTVEEAERFLKSF